MSETNEEAGVPELVFTDVEKAAERVRGHAIDTPVLTNEAFNQQVGREVFFKPENLQRGGSFKFRGAYNTLVQLSDAEKQAGVVAFSSGNHGKALAMVGALLKVPVVLVLPDDAPPIKVQAARDMGAEVILYNQKTENRSEIAKAESEKRGLTMVPPYDDYRVMAGQGTSAYELIKQTDGLDAVIMPIGGGGLIAGCGTAAKGLNPDIKVYGAEPEAADDTKRSLDAGHSVTIEDPLDKTIAEGIRNLFPGELPFPIIQKVVDDVVLVSDAEIIEALGFSFNEMKLVLEAASATAIAAVEKLPPEAKRVGVILTGGNIEVENLAKLLSK